MEDQLDESKPWLDCCRCCSNRIPRGEGVQIGGKWFCNAEHAVVDARYLRLCMKAKIKAQKYPAHEIDYSVAHFYLRSKLDSSQPHPLRLRRRLAAPA